MPLSSLAFSSILYFSVVSILYSDVLSLPISHLMNWIKKVFSFSNLLQNPRVEFPSGLPVFYQSRREMAARGLGKNATDFLRINYAVFFLVLVSASYCYSADVVFIRSPGHSTAEQEQLEVATNFYGLNLKVVMASSANDELALSRTVEREETVGVVIAADALGNLNRNALLRALQHRRGGNAPFLILAGAPGVDPSLLRTWSGGTALGCKRLESSLHPEYLFGRVDGLTWQLSDLEVPFAIKDASYLVPGENGAVQLIASIRHGDQVSPVFIEATVQQSKVFVACAVSPDESMTDGKGLVSAFLGIAPAMMFIRYCAGERGWHALHHYANFTIDDPWLREPYGYVNYEGLLGEMEKHDFHTTIAFIPWNYDRSEPGVVSLFRNHPERFSIAIHGDNHDHKEFTDYRSKPLLGQIVNLKQSLARMERFQAQTGIPYDKVMIFPHSIAPERTLEALKTYNYLATINSTNVPQDAVKPSGLSFDLRPVTLSFAGLPSISRYSAAAPIPKEFIAINEFLGNPLLFYSHSEFFARGIDAFDGLANEVNKLEPDTQWRSLGDIVRHLYLVKLKDNSNYDVLAFSSNICLDNISGRDAIFYVRKQEIGGNAINAVLVDGRSYPYHMQDGYLYLSLSVPMGNASCVAIHYKNDLDLASIGTSKDSFNVYFLRMVSDFRDNHLSKSAVGLGIIRFYNGHKEGPPLVFGCVFVFIVVCIYAVYHLWVFIRRPRHTLDKSRNPSLADPSVGAEDSLSNTGERL